VIRLRNRGATQISGFGFNRYVLGSCAVAAILAGCGGSQPTIGAAPQFGPTSRRQDSQPDRRRYATLHAFTGGAGDGAWPNAGLFAQAGVLYGTTAGGGPSGDGTVFASATSGNEHVIYSFKGGSDGANPDAPLIASGRELYGTTEDGGADNAGTVFRIDAAGKEHVIHGFAGGTDGDNPYAALSRSGGLFYGTTANGGAFGDGTVFAINERGKERVLYSFGASSNDGLNPYANLIIVHGTLYGTTVNGGAYGEGTVFALTKTGVEHLLYSFGAASGDGANPRGGLIFVRGTLYGTTISGGSSGDGTVFGVTTSGAESVLYSFKGPPDGVSPFPGLTVFKGALYGTTYNGGSGGCNSWNGCGAIFRITTSGQERVLYSFKSNPDGAHPWGGVVAAGSHLYGAASLGGSGVGTIFRISP
jgi:uncharacterized repeat protein (TIGR03803 family)